MLPFDIWKCLLRSKKNQQQNPFIFLPRGRSDRFSQQHWLRPFTSDLPSLFLFQIWLQPRSGPHFYFPTIWSTSFLFFSLWLQSLDSSQLSPIKKTESPWVWEKFGIKGEKWMKKLGARKEVSKGPPRELAVLKWASGVAAARGPGRWLWSFGHMRSPAEHVAALVCLPELKPQ